MGMNKKPTGGNVSFAELYESMDHVQEKLGPKDVAGAEESVKKAEANLALAKKKPNLDANEAEKKLAKAKKNLEFAKSKITEATGTVYVSKNKKVVVKKIGDKFDVESLVGDTLAGPFGNVDAAKKAAEKAASKLKESKSMKVKTNKGEVSLKGNDSIEYEAKPGVVRIGMAGDVLKKGCKFKKDGTWHVMAESKRRHFIFTENGKVADLKDDQLKKLHGQMKDEQLSGSAASQFKGICREMKKRGMSLTEKMSQKDLMCLLMIEGSTENAYGTLKAIIGTLKGRNDATGKDMFKMATGMQDYYQKNKSFSPDQAKWIFKMSKMFK